ncbi:hypothetical protein NOVO_07265 [Rickettsiales bacterium Ac37b]|nr:hypothetical protein NOVO_07265 [Rickettsiales bacterium Ac37b]
MYEDYPEEISEGFMGYRGRYKDGSSEIYDRYKYLGKIDNVLMIWRQWSGGGTGHFSDINPLKRVKNNFILIKDGPGGDRCNGSITDAKIENNILIYKQNITSSNMFDLLNHQSNIVKDEDLMRIFKMVEENYDLLDSCAICCIGEAEFYGDTLTAINFNEVNYEKSLENQYQNCFNQISQKYITEGKRRLILPEIQNFVEEFKKCIKLSEIR